MFKITRKTDYAVRVCVALAKQPRGARLATQSIQDKMFIPHPLLRRIVAELSNAGLVRTFAGPNGGVELARPPAEITLKDIFQVMEGPICVSECLMDPQSCPLEAGCPVRERWGSLQATILAELARTSLRQLAEEATAAAAPCLHAGKNSPGGLAVTEHQECQSHIPDTEKEETH
ncbi:MAG: Rrf2 family transcriptional regulator [Anaerolineae bacterium]|nr:Rrf2 family transcriptional regulator [Anaerolineae bacterium]